MKFLNLEKKFDFLSNRILDLDITNDYYTNFKIYNHLSVFENHVFGVLSQYNRITNNLNFSQQKEAKGFNSQVNLDIYFYTLVWDKAYKIFENFKSLLYNLQKQKFISSDNFKKEFKNIRIRLDHLFKVVGNDARNEYEHPSLEFYANGNLLMWGNVIIDLNGNIKAHAGKNQFVEIRKEKIERLLKIRIELIDLFLKHFSEKLLSNKIIELRNQVEENIDELILEIDNSKITQGSDKICDSILTLIMLDLFLTKEGISFSNVVKEKIYSKFVRK